LITDGGPATKPPAHPHTRLRSSAPSVRLTIDPILLRRVRRPPPPLPPIGHDGVGRSAEAGPGGGARRPSGSVACNLTTTGGGGGGACNMPSVGAAITRPAGAAPAAAAAAAEACCWRRWPAALYGCSVCQLHAPLRSALGRSVRLCRGRAPGPPLAVGFGHKSTVESCVGSLRPSSLMTITYAVRCPATPRRCLFSHYDFILPASTIPFAVSPVKLFRSLLRRQKLDTAPCSNSSHVTSQWRI